MDGIIVIIVIIIVVLSKFAGQTKKVVQNAPGKAAAPVRPAAPVYRSASQQNNRQEDSSAPYEHPVPATPTVKPTVHPAGGAEIPELWQQVSRAFKEEPTTGKKASGHEEAGQIPEGDSRACEHGSVGGSMAYEAHEEGGRVQPTVRTYAAASDNQVPKNDTLYRPAMNAQEMRRAVVMAEILKRPQERMAEQARRWSVR